MGRPHYKDGTCTVEQANVGSKIFNHQIEDCLEPV